MKFWLFFDYRTGSIALNRIESDSVSPDAVAHTREEYCDISEIIETLKFYALLVNN